MDKFTHMHYLLIQSIFGFIAFLARNILHKMTGSPFPEREFLGKLQSVFPAFSRALRLLPSRALSSLKKDSLSLILISPFGSKILSLFYN